MTLRLRPNSHKVATLALQEEQSLSRGVPKQQPDQAQLPVELCEDSFDCIHLLTCRKSKASGGSPSSSGVSQVGMPGQSVHWDVSQTKASATNFSIGSSSMVQRSGLSMNSVGTHLGSNTGLGLVSATYSPLSHQGNLLRQDVDNQKNLRQADLNSVKRTPLSLKVLCHAFCWCSLCCC